MPTSRSAVTRARVTVLSLAFATALAVSGVALSDPGAVFAATPAGSAASDTAPRAVGGTETRTSTETTQRDDYTASTSSAVTLEQATQRVFDETNAARAQKGLKPFVRNTAIDRVAQAWAQQQGANGAMSHNPYYSKQIPAGWSRAGENVARNYTYDRVVAAWLASPEHYANIMNDYTDEGIGYFVDAGGNINWTVNFGTYATTTQPPVAHAPLEPSTYPSEPATAAGAPIPLASPSFETGISGWTGSGAAAYGPQKDVRGGQNALAITGSSSARVSTTVTTGLRPGETYVATIWVRAATATRIAGTFTLSTGGDRPAVSTSSFSTDGLWAKVTATIRATGFSQYLTLSATATSSGAGYVFDSASLVRITSTTLPAARTGEALNDEGTPALVESTAPDSAEQTDPADGPDPAVTPDASASTDPATT